MSKELDDRASKLISDLYAFYRDTKYDREQHDQALADVLARYMYDLANGNEAALHRAAAILVNVHPTIQQNIFRTFIMTFLSLEEKKQRQHHYDDRNRATVEGSRAMLEAVKEMLIPLV